jgi:hypothetical protein
MKRIISLALLVLGMHVSMHASMHHTEPLIIAGQQVKSVALWHGNDELGFFYECYFGELAGDGNIIVAMECTDTTTNHQEYFAIRFPMYQELEGESSLEVYTKLGTYHQEALAAHCRESCNIKHAEWTKLDGKAYEVTTHVPIDASPEFKSFVTEKFNIKVALGCFIAPKQLQRSIEENALVNIKDIDESGVISVLISRSNDNPYFQSYVGKDRSTGALIIASAHEGLACAAEAMLLHRVRKEINGESTNRAEYPVQFVENTQEVYTALEKLYKERFANADHYAGALELFP